jgi:hypothetical protein
VSQEQASAPAGEVDRQGPVRGAVGSDALAKSHRYVRTAMIALLLGLAIAVFHQSAQQGSFLPSVSAYYYTPAQGIFVGALIALGTCMIALRPERPFEDVALNIGGAFAFVVAVVPTARDADYQEAARACREAGDSRAAGMDCSTVAELQDATRAAVANNMVALLAVGFLAIAATVAFILWDRRTGRAAHSPAGARRATLWGLVAATALWLSALLAVTRSLDRFVALAHYVAAVGLFLTVVVVALINARRHAELPIRPAGQPVRRACAVLISPRRYRYTWIAAAMAIVAVVGTILVIVRAIPLFWLQIAVAALFAAFWTVQTIGLDQSRPV